MGVEIKLLVDDPSLLPIYGSDDAAGADLRASCEASIQPGCWAAVPTGIRLEIPRGFEGQVRPRSGLALKTGLTVLNAPGTIDADYRGEVKVILINHGSDSIDLSRGDRIAQLIIAPVERATFVSVDALQVSARGDGGFGSTGVS